jgi:hypothetical protein
MGHVEGVVGIDLTISRGQTTRCISAGLEVGIERKEIVLLVLSHEASLGIFTHALLEEVGLTLAGQGRISTSTAQVCEHRQETNSNHTTQHTTMESSVFTHLERDELHPIKGVGRVEKLLDSEGCDEVVGNELNVLAHHTSVDPDEVHREGLGHKLLLHLYSVGHDFQHTLLGQLVLQHSVQQAREVAVQTLITGDELVGEGEARHEATLL